MFVGYLTSHVLPAKGYAVMATGVTQRFRRDPGRRAGSGLAWAIVVGRTARAL